MLAEHTIIFDPNNIILVVLVMVVQIFENLQLNSCLVLEFFLISDDLDSHHLLSLVIEALDSLSKAALAEELEDLISVAQVVLEDDLVVTLIVIITVIEYVHLL